MFPWEISKFDGDSCKRTRLLMQGLLVHTGDPRPQQEKWFWLKKMAKLM